MPMTLTFSDWITVLGLSTFPLTMLIGGCL